MYVISMSIFDLFKQKISKFKHWNLLHYVKLRKGLEPCRKFSQIKYVTVHLKMDDDHYHFIKYKISWTEYYMIQYFKDLPKKIAVNTKFYQNGQIAHRWRTTALQNIFEQGHPLQGSLGSYRNPLFWSQVLLGVIIY